MASNIGKCSENDSWMTNLRQTLWQQSKGRSELCDVTITLQDDQELKAHWCILVLCPFFEAMNRSEMSETSSGTVNLSQFDVSTMQFVLEYMYTGRGDIIFNQCEETQERVIELADFLLLQGLKTRLKTLLERADRPSDLIALLVPFRFMRSHFHPKPLVDKQWLENLESALWKQCLDSAPCCDVTIKAMEWKLSAHRCVLSVCPYFEAMFTNGNKSPDSGVVDLGEFGQESVKLVLEYIYTGKQPEFTLSNIESVLKLSGVLGMESLVTHGREYCMRAIDGDCCLQIRSLAKRFSYNEMYEKADKFLCAHFSKNSKTSAILEVSFDDLMRFIQDLKLSYFIPAEFFELTVSWVKHQSGERLRYFDELFSALKLELITPDEMARIKENEYVTNSPVCKAAIEKYESDSKEGRINPGVKDVVVVCGSYYRWGNEHLVYSVGEERWVRLPISMLCSDNYMTVANKQIILSGRHNEVHILDAETKSWSSLSAEFNCFSFRMMTVVSCAGYICCVSGLKHYIKLYPTRPDIRYRYVEITALKNQYYVSAFSLKDEAILILAKDKEIKLGMRYRFVRCLLYDVQSGEFSEYPVGARYGEFMCNDEDGGKVFVFQKNGSGSVFDYADRRWKAAGRYIPPPEGVKHVIGTFDHDEVYVAVGAQCEYPWANGQLYRYKKGWEKLTEMYFDPNYRVRPIVIRIPASLATCPPDCLHCDPHSLASRSESKRTVYLDDCWYDRYDSDQYMYGDDSDEPYGNYYGYGGYGPDDESEESDSHSD